MKKGTSPLRISTPSSSPSEKHSMSFKKTLSTFSLAFPSCKKFLGELFAPLIATYHWIAFRLRMRWLDLQEKDIGHHYRLLVDLDWDEFRKLSDKISLFAIGGTVEIKSEEKHFVISGETGAIHIHQWKEKDQTIEPHQNWKIKTQWYSVYRSGAYIRDSAFVPYLVATVNLVNKLRQEMATRLIGIKIPVEVQLDNGSFEMQDFEIVTVEALAHSPGFVVRDKNKRGGELSFLDAEGFLKENACITGT